MAIHLALLLSSATGVATCLLIGLALGRGARGKATRVALCALGVVVVFLDYAFVQAIVGDPLMRLFAGVDTSSHKTPYFTYWILGAVVGFVAYCAGVFRAGTKTPG